MPPPDSNTTVVRKYVLKYGIGFPVTEVDIPASRNSYIIADLSEGRGCGCWGTSCAHHCSLTAPSSQYVISLKAANNAGNGIEILKDVITKRKSALAEHENLFPPLNVQAVAVSSESVEVRWTDWHLKPDESIPDDRVYSVRYCVSAQQLDTADDVSAAHYRFKNVSERRAIISELAPNTLYDFSVKLVLGARESDWSLTTSQMTMEAGRSIPLSSRRQHSVMIDCSSTGATLGQDSK